MSDLGKKAQEAVQSAESELKKLIQYLNDEVVPAVRKEGAEALTAAAKELRVLAGKLEKR